MREVGVGFPIVVYGFGQFGNGPVAGVAAEPDGFPA